MSYEYGQSGSEEELHDRISQFRWSLAVAAGAFVLLPRELATTLLVLYVCVVLARSSGVMHGFM